MKQDKLTIELVPKTSWFTNLRSQLSKAEWDLVRRATYKKANHRCEICGGKGNKHPVECHEIWEYDDVNFKQTLTGLIALCPCCHEVKHIGLAMKLGNLERAVFHFVKVNKISIDKAEQTIFEAFEKHTKRSRHKWDVDISKLHQLLEKLP